MRLPRLLLLTLIPIAFSSAALGQAAQADLGQAIQHNLLHKLLTLRGLYRTEELRFAADGSAIGNPEVAYAVSDARFDLQTASFKGNKLTLTGDLPEAFYDAKTDVLSYHEGLIKRTVEIDVTGLSPESAMQTFWKVFYRLDETIPATCTLEEFHKQEAEDRAKAHDSKEPGDALVFGERGAREATRCRANGDRLVFQAMRRVAKAKPPRATHTPDPTYPANAQLNGSVILQLIVDPKGQPSSIIVVKSLGPGFDESAVAAVHKWKFEPATREGEPVPVTLNVEVEFHRS